MIESVTVRCPCCLAPVVVLVYASIHGHRAELPDHRCDGFVEVDAQEMAFAALERVNPPPPQAA